MSPPRALLLLVTGCCPLTGPGPAADDSGGPGFAADHAPEWDAAAFAATAGTLLAGGLPLPQDVFADYRELLEHGDGACPTSTGSLDFEAPHGCTSADGTSYRGSGGILITDTRVYGTDGSWTGGYGENSAPAQYVITRPDGTRLEAGGTLATLVLKEGTTTTWSATLTGTFLDDGGAGWLAAGASGDLTLSGSSDGTSGRQTLDGEVSVGGQAATLEALTVDVGACPDGATGGALSLRQSDATWYRLDLPAGCGSCGDLTWNETEALGEACVDLQPILDTLAIASAA